MSIPGVLLAIALIALTRASLENVIIAITVTEVPRVVRLIRSLVLSLREQPYVDAAIAAGTRTARILTRHILPNTVAPLLVQGTYICASAMLTEAILSFLGAGTPPNIPSWGNIMAEARSLFQIANYLIFFPGLFLSLTVLSVNLVGDGLRDALDPRLARNMCFGGHDLLALSERGMRDIRGNEISMIFQEPMSSLNPVLTIGRQITETLILHRNMGKEAARTRAIEMLRLVGIPEPASRLEQYPHEFSGGMRQRVMIAMALACDPKLLIADEPTTALDVTVQAQILDLMRELKARTGTAIILITHSLGVVAEMAQRVVVMYGGRKVEEAPVEALFARPRHPYTRALLNSVPRLRSSLAGNGRDRLAEIEGVVPSLKEAIPGCIFAPRCGHAKERCRQSYPPLEEKSAAHWVACWEADRLPERPA